MLKKFFSVRKFLTYGLILSVLYAAFGIYTKIHYWGFSFTPKQNSNVWTVEAHISFDPIGEPIKISLATPSSSKEFKILEDDIIAPNYKIKKVKKDGVNRYVLSSPAQNEPQDIYYRVLLFDNINGKGKEHAPRPKAPEKPYLDEQMLMVANELLEIAKPLEGDYPQKLIRLFNQNPPNPTVLSFLPPKKSQKTTLKAIQDLLALKNIPTRAARGIRLEESKKAFSPDLMLEAYIDSRWKLYDLKTAQIGVPENFIIFQRGGNSLLDVEGGENSNVQFSVLKSIKPSFSLASKRAEIAKQKERFEYSVYNLPIMEQNTIKWLSIFPLAILVVVLMRNVIGIQTMGTFTPMLIAMSLVKTGFWQGLICFAVIVSLGLVIRTMLSKFNLLLVPRISAVVIFVILIMQSLTVMGYKMNWEIALSAVFFPIIIMAWIIERASITWEEDGPINAGKEIFWSLIVAIFTYFVICNEYIRHIMFAFNEINIVILFIVMLLGTYTGYRITELRRFAPLVKG